MRRFFLFLIAGMASSLVGMSVAHAHAHLQGAVPPAGASLPVAPPALELSFTENLEPRFSAVTVEDLSGKPVDTQPAKLAEGDPRKLIVALPQLVPGTYTVIWRVTAIDTHRTEGRFSFTITGP